LRGILPEAGWGIKEFEESKEWWSGGVMEWWSNGAVE
jgi:hypothetical protein